MNSKSLQARLTAAFVAQRPSRASMTGVEVQKTPDGGRKRVRGRARRPVTFTLCEPSSSGYGPQQVDVTGTRDEVDFELVAVPGTDVRELDEFELDGSRFRVEKLLPDNGYEVRAYVVRVA